MLEQRRVDYLRSMGITLWMPRAALPNAPASRWLPEAPRERHDHIRIANTEHGARPVAAADLLRAGQPMVHHEPPIAPVAPVVPIKATPLATDEAVGAQVATVAKEPAEAITDLTPPRFRLEFLRVSANGIWIADGGQSADEVQRFIFRVMTGMRQTQDFLPQPVSFRWPFIESRHEDQSAAVALQALTAQWQFFSAQGVSYVVSVGEDARQWLQRAGVQITHHIDDIQSVQTTASAKRALWQALRQLPAL